MGSHFGKIWSYYNLLRPRMGKHLLQRYFPFGPPPPILRDYNTSVQCYDLRKMTSCFLVWIWVNKQTFSHWITRFQYWINFEMSLQIQIKIYVHLTFGQNFSSIHSIVNSRWNSQIHYNSAIYQLNICIFLLKNPPKSFLNKQLLQNPILRLCEILQLAAISKDN